MKSGTRLIALLLCACAALTVVALGRIWPHPMVFDPIAFVLLVIVSVATHTLRVKTGPRTNLDLANAAAFAAVLLLPPAAAVVVSGLGALLFDAVPRRVVSGGPRWLRPWETAFNVSQTMLATAATAWVYYRFVPAVSPAPLAMPQDLVALPLAAAAGLLCNILLVTAMVSIQLHVNPARIAPLMIKLDLVQIIATYVAALVTAICAASWPWAVLLLVFLAVLIHVSMRRVLLRFEDTVRAVEAMADVVDTRDPFTFAHSRRVADYAAALCRHLQIKDEEAAAIRLAARVHDLGKIGIPDHVLFKPGKLTDKERRIMQEHVMIGYRILSRFPEYRRGKELVVAHHEWYAGGGYPTGGPTRDRQVSDNVLPVADALDAMTSQRQYREALTFERALAELHAGAGRQWHPAVVAAADKLYEESAEAATRVRPLRPNAPVVPA